MCFLIDSNSAHVDVDKMYFSGAIHQMWKVVLVDQNVFMNKIFKQNYLSKLRSFFKFNEYWDEMYEVMFGRESLHKGHNLAAHMKTTVQLRNYIYVCRLMAVAVFLKKRTALLEDESFRHCFRGVVAWYMNSVMYERDGQNFVSVGNDSLAVHDSRGTTTTYSFYFIKKLHDISAHASK
jgi:hypothetical protein